LRIGPAGPQPKQAAPYSSLLGETKPTNVFADPHVAEPLIRGDQRLRVLLRDHLDRKAVERFGALPREVLRHL